MVEPSGVLEPARFAVGGTTSDIRRGMDLLVETAKPEWFIWQSDRGCLPPDTVKHMLQRFGKEILPYDPKVRLFIDAWEADGLPKRLIPCGSPRSFSMPQGPRVITFLMLPTDGTKRRVANLRAGRIIYIRTECGVHPIYKRGQRHSHAQLQQLLAREARCKFRIKGVIYAVFPR